jgi:hypothetical protein
VRATRSLSLAECRCVALPSRAEPSKLPVELREPSLTSLSLPTAVQQIFIELTLKTEQEEYVREQIKWTPIDYFNNKIVCDLIEEKRPPGVFAALNDAVATAHADPSAADNAFVQRLSALTSNPHFESRGSKFLIKHYAGEVLYNVGGMTDKNKDSMIKDLLDLVDNSANGFLRNLFPEKVDLNNRKKPPTAGDRIKASANDLVQNLMKAQPSYIRTIKPNQNRSPAEYDSKAILHQIKYLGLQENIRVRRAGFAYRNTFEKMVERFYLLSPNTSYAGEYTWQGDAQSGCAQILKDTGIAKDEWQMGTTKAFIKNPETVRPAVVILPSMAAQAHPVLSRLLPPPLAALCARDNARPVLAQHGGAHPAGLAQLHPLPDRVRDAHPALLAAQEGRHRICARPAEGSRPARRPQGAPALLAPQLPALRRRLPRRRRQGLGRPAAAGGGRPERRRVGHL